MKINKFFSWLSYLPAVILLVGIFVPFVANFFVSNTTLMDNRPLYTRPTQFSATYFKDWENYYNDTFAGRKKMIRKYLKLRKKLGFSGNAFFLGEEGWTFYDSQVHENSNSIIDYYGLTPYSDDELTEMKKAGIRNVAFYRERKIPYAVFVAGNKENVYSEYMPTRYQKSRTSDTSRMDKAVTQLSPDLPIINLKPTLIKAKENSPVLLYYKTDTHWNDVGGYIAFREIMHQMEPTFKTPELKTLEITQDGLKKGDMSDAEDNIEYRVGYLKDQNPVPISVDFDDENHYVEAFENKSAPIQKTIIVFRDSFGGALVPYISRAYAKSYFIHRLAGHKKALFDIVEQIKPDIVVDVVVERLFPNAFLAYDRTGD